jgi:FtsH-binding integral membrane protein
MEQFSNPYAVSSDQRVAALAAQSERTAFIQRTYAHLAAAVVGFVVLEGALLSVFPPETLLTKLQPLLGGFGWLIFLGAFMGVSWLARSWATSSSSQSLQYAGLSLYVVAEALIFLPLMAFATLLDPNIPLNAGIITGIVFAGLTAMVFITKADFSGLGKFLWLGGLVAMGLIVVSLVMGGGFGLGVWFSGAMVLLAVGYILYDTSNIMHHYRTDQHVAAALALFASVALLFYYVIRILIALRDQ